MRPLTAAFELRRRRACLGNEFFDRSEALRRSKRADIGIAFEWRSDLELSRQPDETRREVVELALVDEKPRRRHAHLPCIAEFHRNRDLRGLYGIAVRAHDHRRVAAEFHRHSLQRIRTLPEELLADVDRACERYFPHGTRLHHGNI